MLPDHFKYLGAGLDSTLTFRNHIRGLLKVFSVSNFKLIGPYLLLHAAQWYLNAMIFSYLSYCLSNFTLKPIESLYKQTLYKKPNQYHNCHIIQRLHLFGTLCQWSRTSYSILKLNYGWNLSRHVIIFNMSVMCFWLYLLYVIVFVICSF